MMRVAISRLTTDGSSAKAALEIIASPGKGFFLRALDLTLAAATASVYALGRPAAVGVTPTSPAAAQSLGTIQSALAQTTSALAWGTGPTVPAAFFRQVALPASIGNPITLFPYSPDHMLFVPAGNSLVLWNVAANSVAYVNALIDEIQA